MQSQVYVINLDRSEQRLAHCRQQLVQEPFTRIAAVDGARLSPLELQRHYDPACNLEQYHKSLGPGEIGCYLSHRKAWQQILDDGVDFGIVLEDDFILHRPLDELLTVIRSIGQPWHYIKLAEQPLRRKAVKSTPYPPFELVVYNKVPSRTCAQAVSREGAKRLLAATERFGRPVDIDLQYWWEIPLHVYGLQPYAFSPRDTESVINSDNSRSTAKSRRWSKVCQQVSFYLKNKTETRAFVRLHRAQD